MRNYVCGIGASALVLVMGSLPMVAFAETGSNGVRVTAQETTQMQEQQSVTGMRGESSSAEIEQQRAERVLEMEQEGLPFMLEGTTTRAVSFEQLRASIERREQELDQEDASSSPDVKDIVKNANPVRLAVHSLLASKGLLGGIGQQVSDIAQEMNDSIATTTIAEARIQSRGFFARLFFGGDTTSADMIAQEATLNQQRIDRLTALISQANISAQVRTTLQTQITALKDAQVRLQDLAQKEKAAWGLFSWRF